MSTDIPRATVVFGTVTPQEGDIIQVKVHHGCTKEVSSFDCLLQNWNGKFSPSGISPINVGLDGSISLGRGSNVPLLLTCHVENVKYESTPSENYVDVSGRCWGERLFRRVVTKTYENMKGEDIVKDLIDYYVGLSHTRNSTELIETTDTTYTKLEYEDTPVMDILTFIAESADKTGLIGYDFRVAPDAKFEFFPRNSRASSANLADKIESTEYSIDIHRIRNRITVYGAADKSAPLDKDAWTESLTPDDGDWSAISGEISLDTNTHTKGAASVMTHAVNLYYAASMFTLNEGKEINSELFPLLGFWIKRESSFNGNANVKLYDAADRSANQFFEVGTDEWFHKEFKTGPQNADAWSVETGFDWTGIRSLRFEFDFDATGTGSYWVDGLFFGGQKYSFAQEDIESQRAYGLRELVEVDEELCSDIECSLRAGAMLSYLKDPAESLTLKSTVVDYGNAPVLAGDTVHVVLPNENVDDDFRVLSAEYLADARTQSLELTLNLGREQPLLADYLFALRSKTDHLSRHKVSR